MISKRFMNREDSKCVIGSRIIYGNVHKKKMLSSVMLSVLLVFTMTACGSREGGEDSNIYAQVNAIEGNSITLALAQEFEFGEGEFKPEMEAEDMPAGFPEGEAPSGQLPADFQKTGEDGSAMDAPMGNPGNFDNGGEGEMQLDGSFTEAPFVNIQLTGEIKKIQVTEDTIFTINGETASFADLAVGEYVDVEMKGSAVVSITTVIGGHMGDKMQTGN